MTSRIAHIRPIGLVVVTAGLVFSLSACSDSTDGSGTTAATVSAASGSSSSSSGSGSSGSGAVEPATDLTGLTKLLATSTAQGTTVHLTLATDGTGEAASAAAAAGSGQGDVKTGDGGKTEAFSFDVGSGDTAISLVYVDGTGYVKLPTAQQSDPSKPWAKVSDSSSNPTIAAISKGFDQIDSQTSLSQYAALLEGASNFQAKGESEVDGTKVQTYSFDVDPASLPNADQFGGAASQLGPIPTTMAVDEKGRLVQVVENISVAGETITTTVSFSDYGKDVSIEAPPAEQTSTD